MWAMWLNRVGIILHFLAGFLVAPELLGTHRLEWADARLKRFVEEQRRRRKSGGAYIFKGAIRQAMQDSQAGFLTLVLFITTLFWISLWWVWYTQNPLWALIPLLLYVAVGIFMFWFSAMAPGITTSGRLMVSILGPLPNFISGPFWATSMLMGFAATVAMDKLVGPLLRVLEGADNRVRLLLVPMGIACFIIGTLLQFISTFL